MLRPNNNQLYSYYVSLLIPTEYLQYYLQYIFCLKRCKIRFQLPNGMRSTLTYARQQANNIIYFFTSLNGK